MFFSIIPPFLGQVNVSEFESGDIMRKKIPNNCSFIIRKHASYGMYESKYCYEKNDEDPEEIGEAYGFTMFNVSFDTTEMKEALVSRYDEKIDKTEAVYENKIDAVFLHGDEAMEKLDGIFKELELDPEMDDEDMIKETSKAFEVIDYKSMKLKVTFKGRDTKELMMTK